MATHGRNLTRLAIYNETTYGTLVVGGRWDHLGGYPSVRDDVDDQNRNPLQTLNTRLRGRVVSPTPLPHPDNNGVVCAASGLFLARMSAFTPRYL